MRRIWLPMSILLFSGLVGCNPPAEAKKESAAPVNAADEVLKANQTAMSALKSFQASCATTVVYGDPARKPEDQFSVITAQKPNKLRYDAWEKVDAVHIRSLQPAKLGTPSITFASDGTSRIQQIGSQYKKDETPDPAELNTPIEPWNGFFSESESILGQIQSMRDKGMAVRVTGPTPVDVDGVACDSITFTYPREGQAGGMEQSNTYNIAKSDHLARQLIARMPATGTAEMTITATLFNIKTDPQVSDATFAYSPPKGVELYVQKAPPQLLTAGTKAPDFTVTLANGKKAKLSDYAGKVVVLDFWASWCGPCMASMPHTNKVSETAQKDGVPMVVLAVDDGEEHGDFQKWTDANGPKYASMIFAHSDPAARLSAETYHVSGIPSQYVIDKKGKIVAAFQGYGGETDVLRNAIDKANK